METEQSIKKKDENAAVLSISITMPDTKGPELYMVHTRLPIATDFPNA